MRPQSLIAVTTIFAVMVFAPATAGPEMPMYQFPQVNQIPILPQIAPRPREVACMPTTAPSPQGEATVAASTTSSGSARYHVVDGKCVPVGAN